MFNFGSSDAHSMIMSARIRTVGGIVKFKALAVLRLTTSSNLVGCSTGMSTGFPPLEDEVNNLRAAPPLRAMVGAVGHKAACLRELAVTVDSRQTQAGDDRGNFGPLTKGEGVLEDRKAAGSCGLAGLKLRPDLLGR